MERRFEIGGKIINDESNCYTIAEIGHNHQGKLDVALQMMHLAKFCGVDAVKFQKRDNRSLFTKALYDQPYLGENSYGDTYGAHREALEFGREEFRRVAACAKELQLDLICTAFDVPSADFLAEIGIDGYKIASGDLKNTPLLAHVASMGKPVIISTGGGTMEDVERAHETVRSRNRNVAVLQCTASYPVEPGDMNLRVISTYRERFPESVVGLSDHQNGIAMSMLAYTLGARIVEKHFTINRAWKGTDHAFSLEPTGLHKLVRDLHRAREAMGDGVKRPLPCEEKPLFKMGKKLVAARSLTAGTVLSRDDVAVKSPGDGVPPCEIDRMLGKRLARDVAEEENLSFDLFAGV